MSAARMEMISRNMEIEWRSKKSTRESSRKEKSASTRNKPRHRLSRMANTCRKELDLCWRSGVSGEGTMLHKYGSFESDDIIILLCRRDQWKQLLACPFARVP